MMNPSKSVKVYIGLVALFAAVSAVSVYLPQGDFVPTQETGIAKPVLALANAGLVLVIYGGLGLLGLKLARKIGFAEVWDAGVSNRQRFLIPALLGIGIGIFIILSELLFGRFHSLGPLPHPPFPTSIAASIAAAIGEEIVFRLFFIPFWVWLVSFILLKKRWQNQVFWVATFFSAIVFSLAHLPTIMILYDMQTIDQIPPVFMGGIFLVNSVVTFFAAYYFRKFGFLAAVGIHFWADIVWHVIWGLVVWGA